MYMQGKEEYGGLCVAVVPLNSSNKIAHILFDSIYLLLFLVFMIDGSKTLSGALE